MSRFIPNPTPCRNSRRSFLWEVGGGFASLALVDLLSREGVLGAEKTATHHKPKAKHCIFLFMNGAPSQVDTFDPKPELAKYDGKTLPIGNLPTERKTGAAMRSPFAFQKYGQSGLEVSEIFRHVGEWCADDLCVIRSMHANV